MERETWTEWFDRWCVDNGVLTDPAKKAVKNTDFYVVARRQHARNASDRVLNMQLEGALRECNGASRAAGCRPRRTAM